AAGAVLVAGAVAVATGLDAVGDGHASGAVQHGTRVAAEFVGDSTPEQLSRAFRAAADRAMPGVVHVQVEAVRKARVSVPEPFRGTPWEDLFRRGEPQSAPRQGSGSG